MQLGIGTCSKADVHTIATIVDACVSLPYKSLQDLVLKMWVSHFVGSNDVQSDRRITALDMCKLFKSVSTTRGPRCNHGIQLPELLPLSKANVPHAVGAALAWSTWNMENIGVADEGNSLRHTHKRSKTHGQENADTKMKVARSERMSDDERQTLRVVLRFLASLFDLIMRSKPN